jgi:hypothetical protein
MRTKREQTEREPGISLVNEGISRTNEGAGGAGYPGINCINEYISRTNGIPEVREQREN